MLAILTTHPIQYQTPLWRALAEDGRVPFEVWFMSDHGARTSRDRDFGKTFAWDIDSLSGYPHRFLAGAEGAPPSSFWRLRLREPLRDRIRRSGVDVLWIQGWQVAAYWQAVREARAASARVWLRGESNDLAPRAGWKVLPKRLLLGQLFGQIDQFLCIGSANRRLYERYGVPAERLHRAPYAVDNARFGRQADELRPRRQALRRAWGIADDAFCVLSCGKFIAKKRPLDLIAAARRLQAGAMPKIHLLFVGAGEMGAELRAACEVVHDVEPPAMPGGPASGRPTATFAGFLNQTEISRAYVAADCLALPSDAGETWGLVVNEALASGLPCVASDACGCAGDLIRPIDPRLTFGCGDIEALAEAIQHVQRAPPSTARLAAALAGFSFAATVDTIGDLTRSVPKHRAQKPATEQSAPDQNERHRLNG